MLEHGQMYRLINSMDGVPVDASVLGAAAQGICRATVMAIEQWFAAEGAELPNVARLADEVWGLLHGMASLYLGRAAQFSTTQAQGAVLRLLLGSVAANGKQTR